MFHVKYFFIIKINFQQTLLTGVATKGHFTLTTPFWYASEQYISEM